MMLWMPVAIFAEVAWNYWKIEIKREYQKHWLWAIPKFVVGTGILFWLISFGYLWYWAGLFIVATHMFVFPEGLNKWRGKAWGYMGELKPAQTLKEAIKAKKSLYDWALQKVIHSAPALSMWFFFRLLLAMFAIGNLITQGKMLWCELQNNC